MASSLWKKWKKRQSLKQVKPAKTKSLSTATPKDKIQAIQPTNKILLLGAGHSGKRTIYNVVVNLHKEYLTHKENNFDKETQDRLDIYNGKNNRVIRQNCVSCILTLLKKSHEIYEKDTIKYSSCLVNITDIKITSDIQLILNYSMERSRFENQNASFEELAQAIYRIWKLEAIQETWKLSRMGMYHCIENIDYFFDNIAIIMSNNYQPTTEDRLKERVRTTGSCNFWYEDNNGNSFDLYLTGGQRNERKKWIQLFEAVKCVIFVCGLDHYCKVLFEDESKNALKEDIELWEEIANCKWFRKTKIVLILNKTDLFYECLRCNSLKFYFGNEYKGQIIPQQRYNAVVYDLKVSTRIIQLACNYVNEEVSLPSDIIMLVLSFFHGYGYRWDMMYVNAIDAIKKTFLEIRPDIEIYESCALNMEEVNAIMEDIQHATIVSK